MLLKYIRAWARSVCKEPVQVTPHRACLNSVQVTPPPRSLGIFALPPLTHNGEEIEVDGQGFVVTSVVVQMKLNKVCATALHTISDWQVGEDTMRRGIEATAALCVMMCARAHGTHFCWCTQGKYVRDHSRLDVQPTGRYFLNLSLDNLLVGGALAAVTASTGKHAYRTHSIAWPHVDVMCAWRASAASQVRGANWATRLMP